MNTFKLSLLVALLVWGTHHGFAQESTNAAPAKETAAVQTNAPAVADASTGSTGSTAPATAATPETLTTASPVVPKVEANGEKGLRLNFRGVPLEMVLSYLSEAAGFIIVLETDVKGKVDVWSQQPLTKDEAVNLLNSILNKNGYAAIRNGRTLTIVSRDEAKKRDIPVKTGSDPAAIPKNDEMVTQIIPVRYANATQMTKDLSPLLPTFANLTANESGNALVLTDVQSDIRRMVEIVKALDTSISSISAIRVFTLRYADAKDLATVVKELFPPPAASTGRGNNNDPRATFMQRFGGGGPGGQGGGQGAGGGTGQSEARQAASKVTAVADERTNALIVSAPDEVIPIIEQLVKEIDTNAENITELRVFHLKNSDPVEMADLLTSLFPDDSRTDTARSSFQFGRGGFGGMGRMGAANQAANTSTRAKQKGKVTSVPDQRTSSLVVSAASDLMPQIEEMVAQLDADPAKRQKVYVYQLENADVDSVQSVLRDMFESQNSTSSRNSSRNSRTTSNALTTRQNQANQSMGQNTSQNNRGRSGGSSLP